MGAGDDFRHQHDYDLPGGRMLRVQRGRGWAVYCEFGELLLTQEGDARDFVMKTGDRVFINTHGRVLVEACRGSRLSLLRPRRSAPGRPVVRVLPERTRAVPRRLEARAGGAVRAEPLSYERVFRSPRLMERLVAQAHRDRNELVAACAGAAFGRGVRLAARMGRAAAAAARALAGALVRLRPQLPSLQETFAALVFLRSRL